MSSAAPTAGPENAAVRKVIYSLAELNGDDVDPTETSLIEAAGDALENVQTLDNRVTELEAKLEALEDRAPEPGQKDYDRMDKDDKATVIRQKLKEVAQSTNGKASMQYKDVMAVFDGRPSPGHAYDIMDRAGNMDGFNYGESPGGDKRLTYSGYKTSA